MQRKIPFPWPDTSNLQSQVDYLATFPKSDIFFESNNTEQDVSVSVCSIHNVISESVLSSDALSSLSVNCLTLWNAGSSHFIMSAPEQHANLTFCVLQHKSPSEKL
jgi:hypothetical protein